MENMLTVKATWDSEANVWVAESEDVPGLITEADTMEQLIARLHDLIPDLLEENGMLNQSNNKEIPFHLYSEREETVRFG